MRRRGEGAQQAESREEKRFSDAVFHGICLFLRFVQGSDVVGGGRSGFPEPFDAFEYEEIGVVLAVRKAAGLLHGQPDDGDQVVAVELPVGVLEPCVPDGFFRRQPGPPN